METFKKTKMFKRIMLILVFLILFNFTYPTVVKAGIWDEIGSKLETAFTDYIVEPIETAFTTYVIKPIKTALAQLLAYAITRNMSCLFCSRRCDNGFS